MNYSALRGTNRNYSGQKSNQPSALAGSVVWRAGLADKPAHLRAIVQGAPGRRLIDSWTGRMDIGHEWLADHRLIASFPNVAALFAAGGQIGWRRPSRCTDHEPCTARQSRQRECTPADAHTGPGPNIAYFRRPRCDGSDNGNGGAKRQRAHADPAVFGC